MSNHLAVVYVGAASASNLQVGIQHRVWGFKPELMDRSNYLEQFRMIEPGDLIFLGHLGPSNRVPPGGWDDKTIQRGYLGAVTKVTENATDAVWPDELYPYRPYFELLEEVEGVDAGMVGTEVMEALRLSSNQQSRPVILPLNFPFLSTNGSSANGVLSIDGALDALVESNRRREQAKLRQAKIGGATDTDCALCGDRFPVRHVRAAHIKKRSDCTTQEKLDLSNVMIVCVWCDALYERGDLVVDERGEVVAGAAGATTADLEKYVGSRLGRTCTAFNTSNAHYFAFRRNKVAAAV